MPEQKSRRLNDHSTLVPVVGGPMHNTKMRAFHDDVAASLDGKDFVVRVTSEVTKQTSTYVLHVRRDKFGVDTVSYVHDLEADNA
jgi:hypothetical protein